MSGRHQHRRILAVIFAAFTLSCPTLAQCAETRIRHIDITQIVGHASLDKVRSGIIDELADHGYRDKDTIQIQYENAQGNIVIAAQIAQQFVAHQPDVIVAIATPSAQAASNAAQKTNIPIVFASISDPLHSRLISNLEHPGKNITGTRNVSPIKDQLTLIKTIMPTVKSIGIILNNGEENSVELVSTIKTEAGKQNILIKTASATSSADVSAAANHLASQVDAFLLIQDNTVASALPAVIKISQQSHLPVFATYLDAVKQGAIAGLAFDEYRIGRQTGKIVIRILQGEKPGDIAVEDPQEIELAINLKSANRLNIKLDARLLKQAKCIIADSGNVL